MLSFPALPGWSRQMAEGVSREAVITGGKMSAFERRSGEDGLAKIGVGIEEANEPFDLDVIEFAGQVRNGIVPANQPVGDDVKAGSSPVRR
jgi:hypothetical protein